jgi:predicted RNase H-like nuclease (RuvC/YqgF family)
MAKSDISRLSNKTYISHLEKQLHEERDARKMLEGELDELKRISSEISSHLGITNGKKN